MILVGEISPVKAQNIGQNSPIIPQTIMMPSLDGVWSWIKVNLTFESAKIFITNSSKEVWYYNLPIFETTMSSMWQKANQWLGIQFQGIKSRIH